MKFLTYTSVKCVPSMVICENSTKSQHTCFSQHASAANIRSIFFTARSETPSELRFHFDQSDSLLSYLDYRPIGLRSTTKIHAFGISIQNNQWISTRPISAVVAYLKRNYLKTYAVLNSLKKRWNNAN